jgi:hypothetical protein
VKVWPSGQDLTHTQDLVYCDLLGGMMLEALYLKPGTYATPGSPTGA